MVSYISSQTELSKYTGDSEKLTVLDFTATWCGPCKQISPVFESLAKQNPNVNFLKVDISDGSNELATEYSIRVMPTFIFLQGKKVVHKMTGANSRELTSSVSKFSKSASSGAFSGKGHTLSDESPSGSSSSYNWSNSLTTQWSNLSSEAKILIGLCAAYAFFWLT